MVIEAAEENAVDFDGAEGGLPGGADAAEDRFVAAGDAGDALEDGFFHGVQADGDAREAGVFEGLGKGFEEMAVGGEGQVWFFAGCGAELGELADEVEEAAAEEWFAAG